MNTLSEPLALPDAAASAPDSDALEEAFFREGGALELEWEPVAVLSREARGAMFATFAMLILALLAIGGLLVHTKLVMPEPAPLGATISLDAPPLAPPPMAAGHNPTPAG